MIYLVEASKNQIHFDVCCSILGENSQSAVGTLSVKRGYSSLKSNSRSEEAQ